MIGTQQIQGKLIDQKFKGLLEMIEIEFRSILTDSHSPLNKKKHPEVKEKMEIAVKWIQENRQKHASHIDENLTLLIDSFFSISEHKIVKMYMMTFNIVQKIVLTVKVNQSSGSPQLRQQQSGQPPGSTNVSSASEQGADEFKMSLECRERILQLFSIVTLQDQSNACASYIDENSQIKVLQIIMIFLDPNQSEKISKRFINYILKTCFQLFEQRKGQSNSSSGQSSSQQSQGTSFNFGGGIVKSTIQACIIQLFSIVLENFNNKCEAILGKQNFDEIIQKKEEYSKLSKHFQQDLDLFQQNPIFQVVEDIIQNLATALFIHEQGGCGYDQNISQTSKKLQNNNQNNMSGNLVGGMMGTISNQHIWNFKPSISTKCALLDILYVCIQKTKSIFIYFPKISKILENQIIPTINMMVNNVQVIQNIDSVQGIKTIKAAICVIDNLCTYNLWDSKDSNEGTASASFEQKKSARTNQPQIEVSQESPSLKIQQSERIFKPLQIQNLDQIILNFQNLADFDQVILQIKDKKQQQEISSQNINIVFQKINWRQLVGIEALTTCFHNQAILRNLKKQDSKVIVQCLHVINKICNYFVLFDYKNAQQLIFKDEQLLNFETISQQTVGNQTIGGTFISNQSKKQQNKHFLGNQSFFEMNKCYKVLADYLISEDETLKQFLNPFHLQRLLQEFINGFIIQLELIIQIESSDDCNENTQQTLQKQTKSQHIQGVPFSNQLHLRGLNMDKKTQENEINNILVAMAQPVQEILEKMYLSILCNSSMYQNQESNQQEQQKQGKDNNNPQLTQKKDVIIEEDKFFCLNQPASESVQDKFNWAANQQIQLYTFDQVQPNDFIIQSKTILNSYQKIISVYSDTALHLQRDMFVRNLCSMCITREIQVIKQNNTNRENGNQNQLQIQNIQPQISINCLMASQTLCDIVINKFIKTQFEPKNKRNKISKRSSGTESTNNDLNMWVIIIDTILRLDQSLLNQIEDNQNNIYPSLNTMDKQRTATKIQSQNGTIDTLHLIDFNQIQRKVQQNIQQLNLNAVDQSNFDQFHLSQNVQSHQAPFFNRENDNLSTLSIKKMLYSNFYPQDCIFDNKLKTGKLLKILALQGANRNEKIEFMNIKLGQLANYQQVATLTAYQCYLPLKQDLVSLRNSMDNIITYSKYSDRSTIQQFFTGLQKCLIEFVNNSFKLNNVDAELNEASLSVQLIKRVLESIYVNTSRIELIWDQFLQMTSQLLINQKCFIFKKLSVETSQSFIQYYFTFKKNQKQLKNSLKVIERDSLINPTKSQNYRSSVSENINSGDEGSITGSEKSSRSENSFDEKPGIFQTSFDENHFSRQISVPELAQNTGSSEVEMNHWAGYKWQSTIFEPFTYIMQSENLSDKLMTLRAIEKTIQLCGQNIKNEGWKAIIMIINKSSETISSKEKQNPSLDAFGQIKNTSSEELKLESQVLQHGFKCLKLIINNNIQQLGQENLISIFNCIQRFAKSVNENINSNLTAIGMFMNVADYTAKLSKEFKSQNQDLGRKSDLSFKQQLINKVDFIWQDLFDKMLGIARDHRAEIRRSLIQTMENIIISNGQVFSKEVWNLLLKQILLEILRYSIEIFNQSINQQPSDFEDSRKNKDDKSVATPGFGHNSAQNSQLDKHQSKQITQIQMKKMAFDDETVVKALKQNNDQSWSETCIQLISSIYRTIKMYISLNYNENSQETSFADSDQIIQKSAIDEVWTQIHQILCSVIKHSEPKSMQESANGSSSQKQTDDAAYANKTISAIILQIFRSQEDFLAPQELQICQKFYASRFASQQQIIQKTALFVQNEIKYFQTVLSVAHGGPQYVSRNKSLILKMTPEIIQSFQRIFSTEVQQLNVNQNFTLLQNTQLILDFTKELLHGCKQVGQLFHQFGKPYKLLSEEQTILNFIESFNFVCAQSEETHLIYFEYLFKMLDYQSEAQTEAMVKYLIQAINLIIIRGEVSSQVLFKIIDQYFIKMKTIIDLRYNWQICKSIVFQHMHSSLEEQNQNQNLFVFVGQQLIQICSYLINPKKFKSKIVNMQNNQNTCGSSSIDFTADIINNDSKNAYFNTQLFQISQELLQNPDSISENSCKEIQSKVWVKIIPFLKTSMIFNIDNFDQNSPELASQEEPVFIEVIKLSQNLDMHVMNFVVNDLLTSCGQIQSSQASDIQKDLIQIVDNGCQVSLVGFSAMSISQSKFLRGSHVLDNKNVLVNANLSKFCLYNLFEICKFGYQEVEMPNSIKQGQSSKGAVRGLTCEASNGSDQEQTLIEAVSLVAIKRKISDQTTPILYNKCKDILQKFCKDEQRSGSIKLPQNRFNEVIFILKELTELQKHVWANREKQVSQSKTQNSPELSFQQKKSEDSANDASIQFPKAQGLNHQQPSFLIDLMPILSEMITSNSSEIREQLKFFFRELSIEIQYLRNNSSLNQ